MTSRIPFVNYPKQYHNLKSEIDAAIKGVLSDGNLILRGELRQFEEHMASFIGIKHAIGLNSGTDALILALMATGIGKGES
jgi:dTDP-4-amino-4,6-dideoxygalactose transaminase